MRSLEHLRGQKLTAREIQVLELVARGKTNLEIGADLGLSPVTVKQHLSRIGVKLGIGDRAGILGAAIKTGVLQVPVEGQVPAGFNKGLFDVLVRIARGLDNRQIAAELDVDFEVVKRRVRRLLKLLGARNREQAVVAGFACGVLRLVPVRRRELVAA